MGTNFFCASGGSAAIFLRKGWYKIESRERVKKTKQREVDAVYVNGVKMIIIVDLYLCGVRMTLRGGTNTFRIKNILCSNYGNFNGVH